MQKNTMRMGIDGAIPGAALILAVALVGLGAPRAGAQPLMIEPGWTILRTDSLPDPQAARFNPRDGRLYAAVLQPDTALGGIYRIEGDGSTTLITSAFRPRGIAIDPASGDVFHSEAFAGLIFRTPFASLGRELWVSQFRPGGDADPIGMSIAPPNYTGSVVLPGQALVADEGTDGPREVWSWSPAVPEGELQVHVDDGTLAKPDDVAIGLDSVYVADEDNGTIWRLEPGGALTPVVTSVPTPSPRAVAVDPTTQDLLVLEQASGLLLRIDPASGATSVVLANVTLIPLSEASGIGTTPDGQELIVTDRGAAAIYTLQRLPVAAAPLACGATAAGDLALLGETDDASFAARGGDVVALSTAAAGGAALAPRAALFAPDGSRVALGGTYGGCGGACVSSPLPGDGNYRVVVFDDGHDQAGAYGVTLEAVSGSLGGGAVFDGAGACSATDGAEILLCGAGATGAFDAEGDTDAWTFLGEAGDSVRLTSGPSGGSLAAPQLLLFAPGGAAVALNGSPLPCAGGACDADPLPANGTYTILAADAALAASGAYDLLLEELAGGTPVACQSACSNGLDDDGDGATDTADFGCLTVDDFSEVAACGDGVDNDGDGLADFPADPGCGTAEGLLEDPACDDGRDNDGDGAADWDGGLGGAPDPQCTAGSNNLETASACGIGFELAGLLPLLEALRRRARRRA